MENKKIIDLIKTAKPTIGLHTTNNILQALKPFGAALKCSKIHVSIQQWNDESDADIEAVFYSDEMNERNHSLFSFSASVSYKNANIDVLKMKLKAAYIENIPANMTYDINKINKL